MENELEKSQIRKLREIRDQYKKEMEAIKRSRNKMKHTNYTETMEAIQREIDKLSKQIAGLMSKN